MDQMMLEQFMKISKQIGELTGNVESLRKEMKDGFKEHDEKFDVLFKDNAEIKQHLKEHDEKFEAIDEKFEAIDEKFDVLFKDNADIKHQLKSHDNHLERIEDMIKEDAKDTSEILLSIIRSLEHNNIKVLRLGT